MRSEIERPGRLHTHTPAVPGPARFRLSSEPLADRFALVQPAICAALCALGVTLGWLAAWREWSLHVGLPARATGMALVALCTGVLIGLWAPRRTVLRRLGRGAFAEPSRASSLWPSEPAAFAASFAGVAILALAVIWALIVIGLLHYEDLRETLASGLVWPVWLKQAVLWSPGLAAFATAGAAGAVVLVVLHGWFRLVTRADATLARLWLAILAGGLAAALLATRPANRIVLALGAPLVMFVAGALTVPVRTRASARPVQHSPVYAGITEEMLALLIAWAGALAVGAGVLIHLSAPVAPASRSFAWVATALTAGSGAATLGLTFGRDWAARRAAPLALVVCAGIVLCGAALRVSGPVERSSLSWRTDLPAGLWLTALAAAGGLAVIMASRQIARTCLSAQRTLTWTGTMVAAGLLVAGLLIPPALRTWGTTTVALLVSLAAGVVAGLVLILDERAGWRVRLSGLAALGCGLLFIPIVGGRMAEPAGGLPESPGATAWMERARGILATASGDAVRVVGLGRPQDAAGALIDLGLRSPPADLVFLSWPASEPQRFYDEIWMRRLVRRVLRCVEDGARVVVESPLDGPLLAAWQTVPAHGPTRFTPQWFRAEQDGHVYEALLLSPDGPAWLRYCPWPEEAALSLSPDGFPLGASGEPRGHARMSE